jgi:thiamine-phosphate pyrophosphorylase
LYRVVCDLLVRARAAGAQLFVNDRIDVALVAGADGAHLGRRSLPVRAARLVLRAGTRVGVSVHDPSAARAAAADGADFAFLGTIYDTPSHPQGSTTGPWTIADAAATAPGLPLLAIGGVTPERVSEVLRFGAYGVAVLGGVWDAQGPGAAVERYLGALGARPRARE